jgi:hypothetical protein
MKNTIIIFPEIKNPPAQLLAGQSLDRLERGKPTSDPSAVAALPAESPNPPRAVKRTKRDCVSDIEFKATRKFALHVRICFPESSKGWCGSLFEFAHGTAHMRAQWAVAQTKTKLCWPRKSTIRSIIHRVHALLSLRVDLTSTVHWPHDLRQLHRTNLPPPPFALASGRDENRRKWTEKPISTSVFIFFGGNGIGFGKYGFENGIGICGHTETNKYGWRAGKLN